MSDRRTFLAATALTAASYARVLGANDRVGVGFVGFGLIGKRHVATFQQFPTCRMVAIAEVHRGRLTEGTKAMGGEPAGYRRLPPAARRQGRRRRRHRHAGPLARAHDDDGLRRRQGRVRREAADAVRPRGPLDDRRGRQAQARRAGRHAAALRASTTSKARDLIRGGHIGQVVSVRMSSGAERHARLRQPARRRPAGRPRLRPLARPGPGPASTTRTAASTTSAGSGTTPAGR